MFGIAEPCLGRISVLDVDGPLQVPRHGRLGCDVRARLQRGERCIVVDLANVPSIDAAGVGELVRAYNMATAANGVLRIARPTAWVLEMLERSNLAGLLTVEAEAA